MGTKEYTYGSRKWREKNWPSVSRHFGGWVVRFSPGTVNAAEFFAWMNPRGLDYSTPRSRSGLRFIRDHLCFLLHFVSPRRSEEIQKETSSSLSLSGKLTTGSIHIAKYKPFERLVEENIYIYIYDKPSRNVFLSIFLHFNWIPRYSVSYRAMIYTDR